MENYSMVFFNTIIANDYSTWNLIRKINTTGTYQIYFHPIKISENLIQKIKELNKPSTDASDDGPSTLIPKLNQITYTISVQGKLKSQTAVIGGVDKDITAIESKNYLKDMFAVLEDTFIAWDGFGFGGYRKVIVKSIQFDTDSNNAHENGLPKEVSFNAIFIVADNIAK